MLSRREWIGLSTGAALMGGLIAALMTVTLQVAADQDASTDDVPRLIPYHGILELDGAPVTAAGDDAPWLRFDITDGSGLEAPTVYTQSMQVDLFEGRFTALIGPTDDHGANLEPVVAAGDNLFIRITVLGEHDPEDPASTMDDDIALSTPQRFALAPHAVWATHATHFHVSQRLTANTAQANSITADTMSATMADVTSMHISGSLGAVHQEIEASGQWVLPSTTQGPGPQTDTGRVESYDAYQLLLSGGTDAASAVGIGLGSSNTMFFNAGALGHQLTTDGNDPTLLLSNTNAELRSDLTINGPVLLSGQLISNTSVDINDDLDIGGDLILATNRQNMRNTSGPLTVDADLLITSDVEIGTTLTATGDTVTIDSSNYLTVMDSLDVGLTLRSCTPDRSIY
ncbi:MAG: hypothetical protein AAFS10_02140, partial [Myxococcota bacterium]